MPRAALQDFYNPARFNSSGNLVHDELFQTKPASRITSTVPPIDKDSSSSPFSDSYSGLLTEDDFRFLQKRLGPLHAKLRLGIEADHEAQVFGQGINYFHIENLKFSHIAIETCLKLSGLYWRGRRNATQIEVRHHYVKSPQIPSAFDAIKSFT
jgi:hypothetical protein